MGIQTLVEGRKYRIFVEGAGEAGRRRQFTQVVHGSREEAEQRWTQLIELRDSSADARTVRWPKVFVPPVVYARLKVLADELELSPEEMIVDLVNAAAG